MARSARKWFMQGGSFLLAGGLLYLALRGVDLDRVGSDLMAGAYGWVVPLIIVTLLSHILRAWRWRLFLHALPERKADAKPISIRITFFSLMIGYMSNYAAPRIGEVIRSGNLAVQEKLRFGGVLGTVVVERVLDVITLAVGLLTVPLILGQRTGILRPLLVAPVQNLMARIPAWALVGLLLLTVALLVGAVLLWRRLHRPRPDSRFRQMVDAFREGFATLVRTGRPVSILLSTVAMWACYGLMAYMPLLIFGLTESYDLGLADAWALMLLGSIGVVIPSPGGIGSYHYITIQSMVLLYGVSQASAASYAIFTHAGQLVLYVIVGFAAMLLEGASWSELVSAASKDDDRSDE